MPSRGQYGGAMNESFDQHSAQTPSPSTGSRQETHSVGSAMSSASLGICANTSRQAFNAPRKWPEMERGDGDASASMGEEASAVRCGAQAAKVGYVSPSKDPYPRATASPLSLEERPFGRVSKDGPNLDSNLGLMVRDARSRAPHHEELRRIATKRGIGVPTGMAQNPTAAPILFDRTLLRA